MKKIAGAVLLALLAFGATMSLNTIEAYAKTVKNENRPVKVMKQEEKTPAKAAPAIANEYIREAGIEKLRDAGNIIAAVSEAMGEDSSFNGVLKADVEAYKAAVMAFVDEYVAAHPEAVKTEDAEEAEEAPEAIEEEEAEVKDAPAVANMALRKTGIKRLTEKGNVIAAISNEMAEDGTFMGISNTLVTAYKDAVMQFISTFGIVLPSAMTIIASL
ncbi:hypothetical protein [Youngiibacter fragilis]|uniref:Uncharacterized protein n=1 Tax=Youngiibacter fragilis 232.1 TaxID=994573 RepID=V7HZH9_9CLOT|nr:hypothetical protein [Youngiibacter fragilis]ETA79390.1 hypothetical protein T472_0217070 [Youngiibacter fragilis 232.1]